MSGAAPDDVRERIAKIIETDAWHETLPQDGCAPYWMKRRYDARSKASAILEIITLETIR